VNDRAEEHSVWIVDVSRREQLCLRFDLMAQLRVEFSQEQCASASRIHLECAFETGDGHFKSARASAFLPFQNKTRPRLPARVTDRTDGGVSNTAIASSNLRMR
jgi:hypothetical protein